MQFEGYRRSSHTLNLTPLIDIVFLLLVFFMLTSHFVREQALEVNLPESESGAPMEEKQQLELTLGADGTVLLGEEVLKPDDLEARLRSELEGREDKVVRVRGDESADLGQAVGILDAARKAGAEAVDLVTEGR